MATHRVMGDQPPEPLAGKHAAATSMSKASGENPLFVADTETPKSWSEEVPSARRFRSIAREAESKVQRSAVDNSHTRTTASSVTVTSAVPLTPRGCQRAETTAEREVTWVVGPRVQNLGLNGVASWA